MRTPGTNVEKYLKMCWREVKLCDQTIDEQVAIRKLIFYLGQIRDQEGGGGNGYKSYMGAIPTRDEGRVLATR